MNSPKRLTGGLVALVATLVVAACGSSTPTTVPATTGTETPAPASVAPTTAPAASPTEAPPPALVCDDSVEGKPAVSDENDPAAPRYEEIEAQVEALRGLRSDIDVARGVFDTASLCAHVRDDFRKDTPADQVRTSELLYKELGLMPQDASLEKMYLDLLASQVIGHYHDDDKHMYVLSKSGEIGPAEEIIYAHEYTHALQDQAFPIDTFMGDATDQTDRMMAKGAVIEGDASLLMALWAQQHLTPAELGEVGGSVDPASQALLEGMPPILKDTLQFPYLQGLQLAFGAFSNGGFAGVDGLWANPPDSTEQVLHPEKLATREAPVVVAYPDDLAGRLGDGWTVTAEDTLGEMLLGIVLRDADGAAETAGAAAGWGGDRVALIEGPGDEVAVVLDTAWDTEADAAEFEAALAPTVAELTALGRSPSVLRPAPDRVVLVSAESANTMGRVANALGLAE